MTADEQMLTDAGYEPREEGSKTGWWLHGKRIGRTHIAAAHCEARQKEIVRSCAFLCAEGYIVTMPSSDDPAQFD